jgi:hypothetical protein
MYDELWQDEEGTQNYDAWSTKGEERGERLIVWIRHEATYSAETECYRAGEEWGKQVSCPRQM